MSLYNSGHNEFHKDYPYKVTCKGCGRVLLEVVSSRLIKIVGGMGEYEINYNNGKVTCAQCYKTTHLPRSAVAASFPVETWPPTIYEGVGYYADPEGLSVKAKDFFELTSLNRNRLLNRKDMSVDRRKLYQMIIKLKPVSKKEWAEIEKRYGKKNEIFRKDMDIIINVITEITGRKYAEY